MNVKNTACDMLLQHRVERKLRSKRAGDVINRISITQPVRRDNKVRDIAVPASVMLAQQKAASGGIVERRRLEKDVEVENGGAGIYNFDTKAHLFELPAEWKYDVIPEIYEGKNIADFIDPDIDEKLAALEREEALLEEAAEREGVMDDSEDELEEGQRALVDKIRSKRKVIIARRITEKNNNKPVLPRAAKARGLQPADAEKDLQELGLDTAKFAERARSRSRGKKRKVDESMDTGDDDGKEKRVGSTSRARSLSRKRDDSKPRDSSSYKDKRQKTEAAKLSKTVQRPANQVARAGEGDHRIWDMKPKHLFSGKRGIGKTDRR
jgi:nucleolar GTP-binding protein